MSDEENRLSESDSDDDDYIPSGDEIPSEEDQSEDDEGLEDGKKQNNIKRKSKLKVKARKREGGIKLDEGENEESEEEDVENDITEQQEKDTSQDDLVEKKKADSLWADFMKDVGPPKKHHHTKHNTTTTAPSSTPSQTAKKPTNTSSHTDTTASTSSHKVTITQVFDFAGEEVRVTKEVKADSKEADQCQATVKPETATNSTTPGTKRSGLGGILNIISKKPKIGTLDKSAIDWDHFKNKEGINDDLKNHNKGREGYLEKKAFLERTDIRQFEIEKSVRQGKR